MRNVARIDRAAKCTEKQVVRELHWHFNVIYTDLRLARCNIFVVYRLGR